MVLVTRLLHGLLLPFINGQLCQAQHERTQPHRITISSHDATPTFGVCESRTINYITHTLPQYCLTSSWKSPTPSSNASINATVSNGPLSTRSSKPSAETTPVPTESHSETQDSTATGDIKLESEPAEAAATPFMSFEDWKAMMLQRTGQDPKDLSSRKSVSNQEYGRIPPDTGRFDLGDEDEISLDFDGYLDKHGQNRPTAGSPPDNGHEAQTADETIIYEGDKASLYRSKDAGKTCKERFSYSSFDAGATILKTGPGAKNAKAILVENKDSYMLFECSSQNKYVIVELSDDILIDTMVIANFEFFSSMVRHFRVSVSDRYPVKLDKWRDIGTFEARNSRDIQAFLVENPQIWAKYVRIEFITQYGNEYYCPISLLRVHGSRMLDSWKTSRDEEATSDEDDDEQEHHHPAAIEQGVPEELTETNHRDSQYSGVQQPGGQSEGSYTTTCSWTAYRPNPFLSAMSTCPTHFDYAESASLLPKDGMGQIESILPSSSDNYNKTQPGATGLGDSSQASEAPVESDSTPPVPPSNAPSPHHQPRAAGPTNATATNGTVAGEAIGNASVQATKSSNLSQKQRSAGTSSASAATPTVQEGFFNSITKRLHAVESNLTLSLQYLEDHSRYVQDALQSAERKQLSKVADFLDNLNRTVFAELRGMRDQYDQIWQSTVIALESQREHSEHDIVALSSRLNLLADEVVFQKRMAIVQAVLLLCCLFLVIFSRGVPIPYLSPLLEQNAVSGYYSSPSQIQPQRMYRDEDEPVRDSPNVNDGQGIVLRHHAVESDYVHPEKQLGEVVSTLDLANEQAALAQHSRLSPPLTPSLRASDPVPLDSTPTAFGLQSSNVRRSSSLQHSHSRKPLPALPEHPSPP